MRLCCPICRNAAFIADFFDQAGRKGRIFRRKMSPAFEVGQAGQFPMARNGVFIGADFLHTAVFDRQFYLCRRLRRQLRETSRGLISSIAQPERLQVRYFEFRAGTHNMTKSVGAGIVKPVSVRRSADAERIHHENYSARHLFLLFFCIFSVNIRGS